MLRAWRSADSLRDPARVDAWLDGILVNVCRDRLRRRKVVRFISLADGAAGPARDQRRVARIHTASPTGGGGP